MLCILLGWGPKCGFSNRKFGSFPQGKSNYTNVGEKKKIFPPPPAPPPPKKPSLYPN